MDAKEAEEMVDVVDLSDKVVGIAPRKGIHKTKLMHRAVDIWLIDSKGRIWLELRGDNVDSFPGCYNSSAAGHVSHGESYLDGARREVLEELGIPDLMLEEQEIKIHGTSNVLNEFVKLYIARSDKIPREHEYTAKLQAFDPEEIDAMIKRGEPFLPIFPMLFEWYRSGKN